MSAGLRKIGRALGIGLALLAVLALALLLGDRLAPTARTVYLGGPILTMDGESRVVEAIAVEGDRIAAVGEEAALRAFARERGAEIFDLEGRALLPGFIDAHGHFPGEGLREIFVDLNSPPVGGIEDIDGALAALAERAREADEAEWVIGLGFDDTLVTERRQLTRHDLDRASTSHRIAVLHISGHLAALNSAALAAAGIDADTRDPEGGTIRREADGRTPDGVLEETAMDVVTAHLQPPLSRSLDIFRYASRRAVENGVTTVQSGATPLGLVRTLDWLAWLGVLPVRVLVYPLPEVADAIVAGEYAPPDWDTTRLRLGPVKLITDGSIQGYTGYLEEPYAVPPGDDPTYRGYPRIARERLFEQVERLHAAGFQLAMHGNGDAAIENILDAYAAAQARHPRDDARPIVIHAQMTRPDQLDRMKALGVVPSFFSLHTYYWGDRHRTLFMGPERAARMSPAASALARGLRFSIHCDAPVVPLEPLRLVWSAVNRRTRSGFVVGPEERLPVMAALRAVTIDAAYQHFEEGQKGSLEVGKLADLVILSRSPLADPAHIDEIAVERTIVGGETVYSREAGL